MPASVPYGLCGIRITPLTDCLPVPGSLTYETTGIVSLNLTANIKAGVSVEKTNGCGDVCFAYETCDKTKSFNIDGMFCGLCPEILAAMSGVQPILNGAGDIIGYSSPNISNASIEVMIEIWSRRVTKEGQLCTVAGTEWFKLLIPRACVNFDGSLNFGNDVTDINFTGRTRPNNLLTPAALNAVFAGAADGATAWDLDSDYQLYVVTESPSTFTDDCTGRVI